MHKTQAALIAITSHLKTIRETSFGLKLTLRAAEWNSRKSLCVRCHHGTQMHHAWALLFPGPPVISNNTFPYCLSQLDLTCSATCSPEDLKGYTVQIGWGWRHSVWWEPEKQHSITLISEDIPSMVTSEGATPFKYPNNNLFLKSSPIKQRSCSDI